MGITATAVKGVKIDGFGTVKIAYTGADDQRSDDFAKAKGGRLLTYKEFIEAIKAHPKILARLEGKWFWLRGEEGTELSGHCKIGRTDLIPLSEKFGTNSHWRGRHTSTKAAARSR